MIKYSVECKFNGLWCKTFVFNNSDINDVYKFIDYLRISSNYELIRIKQEYGNITSYTYFSDKLEEE